MKMLTRETPQTKQKLPQTTLEVFQLSKEAARALCDQLSIKAPSAADRPVLQNLVFQHLQPQFQPATSSSTGQISPDVSSVLLEQMAALTKAMTDNQSFVTAQMMNFTDKYTALEERNRQLDDKVAALQQKLEASGMGGAAPVSVDAAVKAAVDAVAEAQKEANELEARKLKLRVTRVPADVQSASAAATLVTDLMSALGVVVEPSLVMLRKPSFSAVAAGTTPAANRTSSISFSVKDEQEKLDILKARKRLRESDRFRTVGVNEDLTKKQQEAKSAAWPAFLAAKQANKRAYWKGGELMIDGKTYQPPPPNTKRPPSPSATAASPLTLENNNPFSNLPSQASA